MTPADRAPAPSPDLERLARGLGAGDRTVLSRAITLIESKRADHRRDRRGADAGAVEAHRQGGACRHYRRAGRRQIDVDRRARQHADGARPQSRRARGRPIVAPHRRIDPRRQDAHGAARQ